MSSFIYKDNILFCENVAVTDIVKEVGTPAYVYSKKTLLDNFDSYSNAFKKNDGLVCFSVKSLSNISVLRLLKDKGSGFDIVSGGELERVLAAGVDPKKIIFTGIAKSNEEIIQGIRKNILSFNIESEAEMLRIEKLATDENKIVDVAIRFNPEIDSGGHEYIKTGRKKDKFGVLLEGVINLSKYILNSSSLNLIGLSCHIGSQIFELNDFEESAKYIKKLAKEINKLGIELKFLDVGGGLGISYTDSNFPSPSNLIKGLENILSDRNEKIILEPGRSVSGDAGILLTSVEYVKDDYLIIDCYRLIDPNDFTRVYNDSFLKKYATALMKRQWGQNLIKFQGVKLPGGIELNGRQIYDDAQKDLEMIKEQMSNTYELPPLDFIG